MTSLEKIIGDLFHEKSVDENVVKCIWNCIQRSADDLNRDFASSPSPAELPSSDLGAALRVVSMISKCNPSMITAERIKLVIQTGLCEKTVKARDFSSMVI